MQISNLPNHYRASFRPSLDMSDFKTVRLGDMNVVIGRAPEGSLHVQSILFPKEKYSLANATIKAFMLERMF